MIPTTTTGLVSPTPACPKCGSYMFMYREREGHKYRLCRNCRYLMRTDKTKLIERIKKLLWKS
jgi:DNA-directed RNA polymerase subunit M/transcription elongation factor TFIIS